MKGVQSTTVVYKYERDCDCQWQRPTQHNTHDRARQVCVPFGPWSTSHPYVSFSFSSFPEGGLAISSTELLLVALLSITEKKPLKLILFWLLGFSKVILSISLSLWTLINKRFGLHSKVNRDCDTLLVGSTRTNSHSPLSYLCIWSLLKNKNKWNWF